MEVPRIILLKSNRQCINAGGFPDIDYFESQRCTRQIPIVDTVIASS